MKAKNKIDEHTKELYFNLNRYSFLSPEEQERIATEVLILMEPYILGIVRKYSASSSSSPLEFEDYLQEGRMVVFSKLPYLKLNYTGKKQLESYLSYWIRDSVQKEKANLITPVVYSSSTYRKMKKNGIQVIRKISLDVVVDGYDEPLGDRFSSLDEKKLKDKKWEAFEEHLIQIFGEEAYKDFYAMYVLGKHLGKKATKRNEEILEYIKENNFLIELLK